MPADWQCVPWKAAGGYAARAGQPERAARAHLVLAALPWHKPGWCFRKAGWTEFKHPFPEPEKVSVRRTTSSN
jgi:hypothetical protein